MSEITEPATPACFPKAHQPETTGIISWIVSPDSCSRPFCFSIASKDIVLKNIVPRTASALRPGRQQVKGHAEDDVNSNDQSAEEPSRAAAIGNEGRGYGRDQCHRHRAWPELQVHRRRTDRVNGDRRGHIKDIVSIRQRPAAVEDRAVPGRWEGDLLSGPNNSYIATLVERHTRYVMLAKVAGKDTQTVVSALIKQGTPPSVSNYLRRAPTAR
jgi:hypothetical protein